MEKEKKQQTKNKTNHKSLDAGMGEGVQFRDKDRSSWCVGGVI